MSDLSESLRKILDDPSFKSKSASPFEKWLMHPDTRRQVTSVIVQGSPENNTYYQTEIVDSAFMPPGYVARMESRPSVVSLIAPPAGFEKQFSMKFKEHYYREIASVFGVSSRFFPKAPWPRRFKERLRDWGNRLQYDGYLDDPEIRKAYSIAIWKAIFEFILRLVVRK